MPPNSSSRGPLESSSAEDDALRAPSEDGGWLIEPLPCVGDATVDFDRSAVIATANSSRIDVATARQELLSLAMNHTRRYRDVAWVDERASDALVMAGHQPQWFHPGVWFKNGVLDRLAHRRGAIGINLVVDNDLCDSARLRFPSGSLDQPHWETLALDRSGPAVPFEERTILDEETFANAPRELASRWPTWLERPLLWDLHGALADLDEQPANLGERLAIARHRLEASWGWRTLEVPLSQLCETSSFRNFAASLWSDARRLSESYNQALWDHRQRYRIRSRSHPVPELESDSEWVESPFWIWSDEDPRRRRLFVRCDGEALSLTNGEGWSWSGGLGDWRDATESPAGKGIKIRTRALLTTWYTRAILCDRFIHGIGGAHYDRLTDEIVRRYWGVELPPFTTATATVRLPVASAAPTAKQLGELSQRLRRLEYHPEEFLASLPSSMDDASEQASCLSAKREWIARSREPRALTYEERVARHAAIERANACLRPAAESIRADLLRERERLEKQQRNFRILGSREISIAMHAGGDSLRRTFDKMLSTAFRDS